jgi:NAD(P)-dependent dehydrogenase (short-subunit alcohol dehydrogenase family)
MANVVITGVSSGIGAWLAERLLAQGHEVVGISRREPELQHALFRWFPADVANWDRMSEIAAQLSSVDALVCCAGVQGEVGLLLDCDPHAWATTFSSNVEGAYFSLKAFLPTMSLHQRDHRAKVVYFSGGGATAPRVRFSAYGCAKAAIVRLVETAAWECADLPVDINVVAPGAMNTAMTLEVLRLGAEKVGKEFDAATKQLQIGGGDWDKLGAAMDFLLNPASDGISGRLIAAQWDDLGSLAAQIEQDKDKFTLRRIV